MPWARFKKKDMPGGLWLKCPACGEVIYKKDLEAKMKVCPKCDHHHTLNAMERIRYTLEEGSEHELIPDMEAVDQLDFEDKTTYTEKLKKTMDKTKRKEAIWVGTGTILGRKVAFGTLDFSFLGGSMGVVVGEKVAYLVEYALEHDLPLVLCAASGGARMHEGALSLMQMAKTCSALGKFDLEGKFYISILANPTTGGVTASWATQADVVIAEPGALIGFAGPRVIKTTLRQDLPEGFQRSEFLINKGQIDKIVHREKIPATLAELMDYCLQPKDPVKRKRPPALPADAEPERPAKEELKAEVESLKVVDAEKVEPEEETKEKKPKARKKGRKKEGEKVEAKPAKEGEKA
jgi:acetyl-CoA carboxylase carboxyl transferase subunit beta